MLPAAAGIRDPLGSAGGVIGSAVNAVGLVRKWDERVYVDDHGNSGLKDTGIGPEGNSVTIKLIAVLADIRLGAIGSHRAIPTEAVGVHQRLFVIRQQEATGGKVINHLEKIGCC